MLGIQSSQLSQRMALRGTLFRGNCSCIPAARSRGNFASERIACMRDVIHRERITCRTRRFIRGKTKNKQRAGGSRQKKRKRRIEGDLRSIKVSPGNVVSSSLPLAFLSPPIRCGPYDRIFTSVSNVLEEYIIHSREVTASRYSHYIHAALHRHAGLVNLKLSNHSLPRFQSYVTLGSSLG